MSGPAVQSTQAGQPAPFDPSTLPVRPAKPKPGPRRFLVPVVGGLILVAVSFGAGYAASNLTATPARTGANGNGFAGGNFGPRASGRPGAGAGNFGGGAAGTVGSVSADQMTITTATGSRIVLLTPTTTVTEVSSATKTLTDIASGQTVTVIGTANPDGSVTATRIVIGDLSTLGGGGRGFFGPGASTGP